PQTHQSYTLALHDALPIFRGALDTGALPGASNAGNLQLLRPLEYDRIQRGVSQRAPRSSFDSLESSSRGQASGAGVVRLVDFPQDRKSTRLNSSHEWISYA